MSLPAAQVSRGFVIVVALASCNGGDRRSSPPPSAPPADAASPDARVLTGAKDAEAAARAYLTAAVGRDEATIAALTLDLAANHVVYECSRRPEYRMDVRIEAALAELRTNTTEIATLAAGDTVELGAWHELTRQSFGIDDAVTIACTTQLGLAIVRADLDFTLVGARGKRRAGQMRFIVVHATGGARVNAMSLVAPLSPPT